MGLYKRKVGRKMKKTLYLILGASLHGKRKEEAGYARQKQDRKPFSQELFILTVQSNENACYPYVV